MENQGQGKNNKDNKEDENLLVLFNQNRLRSGGNNILLWLGLNCIMNILDIPHR